MAIRWPCATAGSPRLVFTPSSAATCGCIESSCAWRHRTDESPTRGPARPRANRRDASLVGDQAQRDGSARGATLVAAQLDALGAAASLAGDAHVRRRG